MVLFGGSWFKEECDDRKSKRGTNTHEIKPGRCAELGTKLTLGNNVGVESSRNTFRINDLRPWCARRAVAFAAISRG